MARGLNKVMLIGSLGADPEIKYAPSGTAIANIRLATAEGRKDSEGNWEEKTEWHRIVLFGRQAEICKDYLRKGSKIYIEGRIQTRSWDDQDGQKHYSTEVIGSNFIMLDAKGQDVSTNAKEPQQEHEPASDNMPKPPDSTAPEQEDDLPF